MLRLHSQTLLDEVQSWLSILPVVLEKVRVNLLVADDGNLVLLVLSQEWFPTSEDMVG